jgi:lipopolysaccharide transport system ATP-binding protein
MNEVIKVEDLGKKYIISHQGHTEDTFRDVITENTKKIFKKNLFKSSTKEEFWALKNISFQINKGDRVGIIGRNGAGKSTLLKLISRITEPTEGRILIRGKIASLLEVGTGFHPELSGRENIFLNGSVLGMSRIEIKKKFDEIVAFSGVEQFLDTPVKKYSSGMYVRLAFAIAAHLDTETLIVDEVLAVGDAEFQKKCLGKMEDVSNKEGRTVLFVSHNMSMITSLCSRSILLDNGKIIKDGSTSDVIMYYYNNGLRSPSSFNYNKNERNVGDDYACILSGEVRNLNNLISTEIRIDQPLKIIMRYRIKKQNGKIFRPNFHFFTSGGVCAFISLSEVDELLPEGNYYAECNIPENFLNEGAYFIGLALTSYEPKITVHFYEHNALSFNVRDPIEGIKTRKGYNGFISGAVRPLLNWKIGGE